MKIQLLLAFFNFVAFLSAFRPLHQICSQSGFKNVSAGSFGTIEHDPQSTENRMSRCALTLTDINYDQLNIMGIEAGNCGDLMIEGNNYCVNSSVKDTIVTVTAGRLSITLPSADIQPFRVEYQKGMYNVRSIIFPVKTVCRMMLLSHVSKYL